MTESQVGIIGAGFAGLAAARRLSEFGIGVELFEATGRVGGRAHTLHDATSGVPVELGAEFVHGRPEATLAVLRAAGFELEDVADRHHLVQGHELTAAPDMWDRFTALLEHCKHMRHDRSARAYMERSRMAPDDAALFAMLVQNHYAAPLDDIGVYGIAADLRGGDELGSSQARPRGGYGALVDYLAKQLRRSCVPVNHSCVVHEIDWGGDRVEIDYRRGGAKGSATADRVIVTVPLGVLTSGTVRFRPALGADIEGALAQLGMGQVVKLVLCMKEPVWKGKKLEFVHFIDACDACFPSFWINGNHQLVAWAGGPHARALAGLSREELVGRACDDISRALGIPREQIADAIVHRHFHDFAADPFSRGAYSYTRVGGSDAAVVLSRPLGNRVFLAGEATDRDSEGSVAGAIASGIRAAEQVLRAMHVVRGPLIIGAANYRR